MPTVIDSLILELGLDSSQLDAAQRKALTNFAKTKDQFVKTGSTIEVSGKAAAAAVDKVAASALGLFAVLVGAKSVTEFAANITKTNAELGRFSANLGQSPRLMAGYGLAVERIGGSADTTRQTIDKLAGSLYDLHQNGQMLPKEFYQLQALTNTRIDTESGLPKFLDGTADALAKLNKIDPQRAHFISRGLGLDDATARNMMQMGAAYSSWADSLGKALAPSNEAIQNAQTLIADFTKLQQEATSLANAVTSDLTPALDPLLNQLSGWIADNKDWVAGEVSEKVKELGEYLKAIDWKAIGQDVSGFTKEANAAAQAVGGWVKVGEALVALWAGGQAIKAIGAIRLAFGAGAGGAAGAGSSLPYKVGTGIGLATGAAGLYGAAKAAEQAHIFDDPTKGPGGIIGVLARAADPTIARLFGYGNKDGFNADGVKVDGQDVSKANPLPVTAVGTSSEVTGRGIGGSTGSGTTPGSGSATTPGSTGSSLTPMGPNAGERGWWTAARQAHAVKRLMDEGGLSLAGAKGLVSRWANVESSGGPSSANNIGGGHYGIAQESRSRGRDIWGNPDFDAQLTHIINKDLKSPDQRSAYYKLKAAQTDAEGAIGASMYERGEHYNAATGLDMWVGKTLGGMRGMDDILRKGGFAPGGSAAPLTPRATGTTPHFGLSGASGAATLHQVSNDNRNTTTSTSSSSQEVHIGTVQVNAPNATDAKGVAAGMRDEIGRSFSTATSNYGPR